VSDVAGEARALAQRMLSRRYDDPPHTLASIDEAIESEAQAQAICMSTRDFERAYSAFASKSRPVFEGD